MLVTTILAVVATYLAEERRISRLQAENQSLVTNQEPAAIQQPSGAALTQAERDELEQLRKNAPELLGLRGEVTRLRQERDAQKQQLASSGSTPARPRPVGDFIPKEQLVNAGTATPEAALQTFLAAVASGNFDQVLATMPPDFTGDKASGRASFEKAIQQEGGRLKGVQITAKRVLSDNKVELQLLVFEEGKAAVLAIHRMVRIGNEWRFDQSVGGGDSWEGDGQVQLLTPPQQ
jgi:hypothetical protein